MPKSALDIQLEKTCQLTGSTWAVWLEFNSIGWVILTSYKINKRQRELIKKYLDRASTNSWLEGALSDMHIRSRIVPKDFKIPGSRLYVFPNQIAQRVILVGVEEISREAKKFWQVIALGNTSKSLLSLSASSMPVDEIFSLGTPPHLPQALDQILSVVLDSVKCQGGWLAIRSGDVLEIKAQFNCAECFGKSLPVDSHPLLQKISQTREARFLVRDQMEWAAVPSFGIKPSTRAWAALPLVIGQRLIGLLTAWRDAPFSSSEQEQIIRIADRIAPSVEGSITFSDLADHLRRMALLNDFALTISSAIDLEQIAQKIFGLLRRAFNTERISMFVLSVDGSTLHHYFNREGTIVLQTSSIESSTVLLPLIRGNVYRLDNFTSNSKYELFYPGSRSALLVPLKYHKEVIGALGLESVKEASFSIYDEHLLVVIGSHLAGLIENGRLRREAESRVRNLSLIHEVVEHVLGLQDVRQVAQISAELLARNFAYELALVILFDLTHEELKVVGIGGSAADVVQQGLDYMGPFGSGGITSRVAITGQSMLVGDVTQDPIYRPISNWEAGSEMCVALREGDRIMGVIDIQSQRRNAFAQNDLLVLESLAGILSSVISNVGQYQKLQTTVDQLRAAREELQDRIAAQQVAESRLVQAAKLAAVGEMAAGIAHELNNPLTTVSGFAELVMDELPGDSSLRSDMELVLRESLRAREVVHRLLDFARQSESVRIDADVNNVISDVLALVKHLVQTNNVQIHTEFKKDLPLISIDRNQIKQVVLNLIHNALHAMPNGGKLFISTKQCKHEKKEWLTILIGDTGIGIPPENIKRVFEPFFTTRSKDGGTGLGLSVSYGIVADHGGFIDVESDVGKGSTFTIWLPIEVR